MTFNGHVERGEMVVDKLVNLPNGNAVETKPANAHVGTHHPDVERYAGVIPPDMEPDDNLKHQREKHS